MARHTLPRGRHARHALPQPVTRHAAVDTHVAAGSVPVRRGIAVVAVVGGALSAAGVAVAPGPRPPDPAETGPLALGLSAQSTTIKTDTATRDAAATNGAATRPAAAAPDAPVLDSVAIMAAVRWANEEGRRLAQEENARKEKEKAETERATAAPDASTAARAAQAAAPAAGRTASRFPGELIDTNEWYLTLPTGKKGKPDLVQGADLAGYHSKFFALNESRDGIVFTANAGGTTTTNSKYPRSELREMNGDEKAGWDGRKGTHTMVLDQAITATPSAKPDVVAGQIHATSDDLMQIHLSGKLLTVTYADGKKKVTLDDDYRLGTRFTVKIESSGGRVKVWYNGQQKCDLAITSSRNYFKAGAYLQSNTSKGDDASAIGQVVVYRADVTHS